ncbi:MAG: hypothetical protein JRJ42_10585 [Deltaproteobacteria bacterium]|nr:hypothetical protein [Deltaproteobacteria bacterium]
MEHFPEIDKQESAYRLTFLVENMLRVAMHNVMVEKVGPSYFDEKVFPEYEYKHMGRDQKINVVQSAKQLKGTEKRYNISLGYDYPYFWYLDFGILISLIDVFWDKYFRTIFKDQSRKIKNEVLLKLRNIVAVRNAVAHHRYVSAIDKADLQSTFTVLQTHLNVNYVSNFGDLALNSFETLLERFVDSCKEIKTLIEKGKFIDKAKLSGFKSSFSAVISVTENDKGISDFQEIVDLIRNYNKLPRKPGSGHKIKTFRKETGIVEKVDSLISIIGDQT